MHVNVEELSLYVYMYGWMYIYSVCVCTETPASVPIVYEPLRCVLMAHRAWPWQVACLGWVHVRG